MTTKKPRQPLLLILWNLHSNTESGKITKAPLLRDVLRHYEIATLRRIVSDGSSNEAKHVASRVLTYLGSIEQ
jgi:hypothetical protein